MKKVFASNDLAELTFVRGLLSEHGIGTAVLNDNVAAVIRGMLPTVMPELWILHDEDQVRAQQVIEGYEYDRTGHREILEPWVCPECGQTIEGQFTECWQCSVAEHDPRNDNTSTCAECGYPLWGLPERRCPECGSTF